MPISYPVTPPSSPSARDCELSGRAVVGVTESPFTGSQQVQASQGQMWSLSVTLPPMVRADAEAWFAFMLKLNGRYGTFTFCPPAMKTPRGIATGTPLVDGASQTGNSLATKGWTATQTGILKAGDLLQLGTGATARLHKVLADANSDGAGKTTLTIWPNLRSSPADSAAIVVSSPVGLFRLASNEMPCVMDVAQHFGLSFGAVEAL